MFPEEQTERSIDHGDGFGITAGFPSEACEVMTEIRVNALDGVCIGLACFVFMLWYESLVNTPIIGHIALASDVFDLTPEALCCFLVSASQSEGDNPLCCSVISTPQPQFILFF